MAGPLICLYYDCLSPFSFFAFTVLSRYEKAGLLRLELRPILLGGVMAATGNLPPGARPWAAATVKVGNQDMARNKLWYNIPHLLGGPANFFGPEGPADPTGLARDMRYQRLLVTLRRMFPRALPAATKLVFEMIWANPDTRDAMGNVVITGEVLRGICEQAGLARADADAAVAAITSAESKALLKDTTAEAVGHGAFGAPFMLVPAGAAGGAAKGAKGGGSLSSESDPEDMVFFGSDRFEQMAFAAGFPWFGPDPERPTVGKL